MPIEEALREARAEERRKIYAAVLVMIAAAVISSFSFMYLSNQEAVGTDKNNIAADNPISSAGSGTGAAVSIGDISSDIDDITSSLDSLG